MGEAEIECNIDDALAWTGCLQARVELGEADVEQHLADRGAEVAAEAELQRADAGACDVGKLDKIQGSVARVSR